MPPAGCGPGGPSYDAALGAAGYPRGRGVCQQANRLAARMADEEAAAIDQQARDAYRRNPGHPLTKRRLR